MKSTMLSLSLFWILASTASAFTLPDFQRPLPPAPEFAPQESLIYNFEGIVALSNCSGSLVRFDDSLDTDKAMVLSNGHCTGMINPDVVIVNQTVSRSFDVLDSEAKKIGTIRGEKILYATMTKTDMALYQVKETYQDILSKYNIPALILSRDIPLVGGAIEVLSGYWKRGYACQIETIVDTLLEGKWTFKSSLRYSSPGCETIGGTSGSPVLAAGTRTVVAVNNTGNDGGRKCEVNNPCEVDQDGTIVYKKGFSYAQQTFWIYSCRNDLGQIDLLTEGCLLPKPRGLSELLGLN